MNQMNVIKSIESLREYIERVNSIGKGEDTFAVIDDDLFRALFPDPDDGEGWRMSRHGCLRTV